MEKVGLTTCIYDLQLKEDKNNVYTLSLNGCNWLSDTVKENGSYRSKEASSPPSHKKGKHANIQGGKGKTIQRQFLKTLHTERKEKSSFLSLQY